MSRHVVYRCYICSTAVTGNPCPVCNENRVHELARKVIELQRDAGLVCDTCKKPLVDESDTAIVRLAINSGSVIGVSHDGCRKR